MVVPGYKGMNSAGCDEKNKSTSGVELEVAVEAWSGTEFEMPKFTRFPKSKPKGKSNDDDGVHSLKSTFTLGGSFASPPPNFCESSTCVPRENSHSCGAWLANDPKRLDVPNDSGIVDAEAESGTVVGCMMLPPACCAESEGLYSVGSPCLDRPCNTRVFPLSMSSKRLDSTSFSDSAASQSSFPVDDCALSRAAFAFSYIRNKIG